MTASPPGTAGPDRSAAPGSPPTRLIHSPSAAGSACAPAAASVAARIPVSTANPTWSDLASVPNARCTPPAPGTARAMAVAICSGPRPSATAAPGRGGRRARGAGGMPARGVVRPAQRVAEPRHHPGRRQVGPGVRAEGEGGRDADRADVRGGLHVQVIEVQDVRGHRPARAFPHARGQPGHRVVAAGQRHRHRVGQRPGGQRQVVGGRLQVAGPLGEPPGEGVRWVWHLAPHPAVGRLNPKICTAILRRNHLGERSRTAGECAPGERVLRIARRTPTTRGTPPGVAVSYFDPA